MTEQERMMRVPHLCTLGCTVSPLDHVLERWVEWIEPFGPNNEPVWMRVPESTAIAYAKDLSVRMGSGYSSDEEALEDFMVVNWATFVGGKR